MANTNIKLDFADQNSPPKDEKMLSLLRKAYLGELLCHRAIIKIESIKPFSVYRPEIKETFRKYFKEQIEAGTYPPLYVYQEEDKFVMSDDYSSYYLYKELGFGEALSVVLGDAEGDAVLQKSEGYILPHPTIEVAEE